MGSVPERLEVPEGVEGGAGRVPKARSRTRELVVTQDQLDVWLAKREDDPPCEEWDEEDPTIEWQLEQGVKLMRRASRVMKALINKKATLSQKRKGMAVLLMEMQEFLNEVDGELEGV